MSEEINIKKLYESMPKFNLLTCFDKPKQINIEKVICQIEQRIIEVMEKAFEQLNNNADK